MQPFASPSTRTHRRKEQQLSGHQETYLLRR
uniref:Uncharacterized protein n=1 Tax=Arundo donax TaxID=35708 RepID=A0A0A9FZN9_ARUDO